MVAHVNTHTLRLLNQVLELVNFCPILQHEIQSMCGVALFGNVDSEGCDELEVFARVWCSNWVGRLWTLQEGRLGKRVWFQFRDKAVELKAIWEAFTTRPLSRGADYWHLFRMIATSVLDDGVVRFGINIHSVSYLRQAMCFRSVWRG
jgi:hypothetical protein